MPRTGERGGPQTRARIAEVAARLFLERGFDAVTVADVAREAGVSSVTVFNHFPRKEDLLLDRTVDAVPPEQRSSKIGNAQVEENDSSTKAARSTRQAACGVALRLASLVKSMPCCAAGLPARRPIAGKLGLIGALGPAVM